MSQDIIVVFHVFIIVYFLQHMELALYNHAPACEYFYMLVSSKLLLSNAKFQ